MKKSKRKELESRGWKVGSTKDFLGLSDEEVAYIELKLSLSQSLKEYRKKKRLTQSALAKKLKSSQSRVAKMEAGDPSVSIDLLVRSLLVLGATSKDVAKSIESSDDLRHKLAS
ncbi:helix-turn-helix protein [bacterium BMS3Abin01]|nr:helix-turn-helix protein [bacterium BMS3Abin01]HDY69967.1 helix-turn-helix domain-containing protein [Actinomycetota bacterium]